MRGIHHINMSIRWKMTLLYTGLLVALLLLCGVFIYLSVARFLTEYIPPSLSASLVTTLRWHLLQSVLFSVLASSLAAVVLGAWVARRLLSPVVTITETATRIGRSGDLSQRIAVPLDWRHDEVGILAATFNTMIEHLERSFTMQQQFIADASHELKTPLAAILGHANLLRRRGRAHPELLEEATAAILEEGERMRRLVLDLLRLAWIGTKRAMLQEAVSLEHVSQGVVKELSLLAQEQKIELTLTHSVSGVSHVVGDQEALKQLVTNVVENALKYTPAGGRVQVLVQQERHSSKEFVVLEVCDTGCGMAPEELPRIFERFYRVDRSRTRESGGSGLGLAIVQEVVSFHGGHVVVNSQRGHGTIFRVYLPMPTGTTQMRVAGWKW